MFRIYDPNGKSVMEINQGASKGLMEAQVNVSTLAPGMYIMGIYENGIRMRSEKFVKE